MVLNCTLHNCHASISKQNTQRLGWLCALVSIRRANLRQLFNCMPLSPTPMLSSSPEIRFTPSEHIPDRRASLWCHPLLKTNNISTYSSAERSCIARFELVGEGKSSILHHRFCFWRLWSLRHGGYAYSLLTSERLLFSFVMSTITEHSIDKKANSEYTTITTAALTSRSFDRYHHDGMVSPMSKWGHQQRLSTPDAPSSSIMFRAFPNDITAKWVHSWYTL